MIGENETTVTIEARLKVLNKALISEENSVQYYQSLLEKTPEDSEEHVGERRMYQDLQAEEQKHVQTIRDLIQYWESQLQAIKNAQQQ